MAQASARINPLVCHHGALGDTIMLTAMLDALAARWGAPCDLITGRAPAALFAGIDSVREVHGLGSRSVPYWASRRQRGLVSWLRQRGDSPVWIVERRHPVAPGSARTRIEWLLERAGLGRDYWVTTDSTPRGELEHMVPYVLRLAALDPPAFAGPGVKGSGSSWPPRLAVAPEELDDCRRWLAGRGWRGEPLILLQTMSRRRKRGRWPDPKWQQLVSRLREERPEAWIALIGAPAERRQTARLAARLAAEDVHDVAAELPLRRLFALLVLAESLVALDSGPAHAAAALGCPVVVLQGTADPRRNRPLGRPGSVAVVSAFGDRWPDSPHEWFTTHDMGAIPVESVLQAWQGLALRSNSGAQPLLAPRWSD
ncbi:MAG: glycosyltransferase family 9 protein [Candidatus Krumholzibacteriia bacterium]